MSTYSKKTYPRWKGDILDTKYKDAINTEIVSGAYATLISEVDATMDKLNDKKTEYENLIYSSEGIIGGLISGINSLVNMIENMIN